MAELTYRGLKRMKKIITAFSFLVFCQSAFCAHELDYQGTEAANQLSRGRVPSHKMIEDMIDTVKTDYTFEKSLKEKQYRAVSLYLEDLKELLEPFIENSKEVIGSFGKELEDYDFRKDVAVNFVLGNIIANFL